MKMPIINFDERFADFMSDWMKSHQDQYETFDDMEEDMPRIYVAFLNTRAKWLGNVTPVPILPSLRIRRSWWTGLHSTVKREHRFRIC